MDTNRARFVASFVGSDVRIKPMGNASGAPLALDDVLRMLPMLTRQEMESLTAWEQSNLGSVGDWPGWSEVTHRTSEVDECLQACSKGVA